MKTGYTVQDIMTKQPVCVAPDTTIKECSKLMKKKKISSILIHDKNKLLGIATEEDFLWAIADDKNFERTKVEDIMTKKLLTTTPDKDIYDVLSVMGQSNVRRLPVMTKKGKLIGIIAMKDIIDVSPDIFDILSEKSFLKEEENPENEPFFKRIFKK